MDVADAPGTNTSQAMHRSMPPQTGGVPHPTGLGEVCRPGPRQLFYWFVEAASGNVPEATWIQKEPRNNHH